MHMRIGRLPRVTDSEWATPHSTQDLNACYWKRCDTPRNGQRVGHASQYTPKCTLTAFRPQCMLLESFSSPPPFVPHAPPISSSPIHHYNYTYVYIARSTNHEAPPYAILSTILSLYFSLVQLFSALSSNTISMFLPWYQRPSFTTIQNHRQN
jgi:hypothetical protein